MWGDSLWYGSVKQLLLHLHSFTCSDDGFQFLPLSSTCRTICLWGSGNRQIKLLRTSLTCSLCKVSVCCTFTDAVKHSNQTAPKWPSWWERAAGLVKSALLPTSFQTEKKDTVTAPRMMPHDVILSWRAVHLYSHSVLKRTSP